MTDAPYIRWMIRRDMPDVLTIEQERFANAWTEDDFIRCLRQRNCIGHVAELGSRVVGFMVYEMHAKRYELLNIAVSVEHERQGIGRAMIEKLRGKLQTTRRNRVAMMLRDDNLEAHLFLRACGFRATRVEREFYDDGQDAYRFELRLPVEVMA